MCTRGFASPLARMLFTILVGTVAVREPAIVAANAPGPDPAQRETRLVIQLGHHGRVQATCFSPDGRLVLTGSFDGTATMWDVESGKALREFEAHTGPVTSTCFSADGRRILTASMDKT